MKTDSKKMPCKIVLDMNCTKSTVDELLMTERNPENFMKNAITRKRWKIFRKENMYIDMRFILGPS